MRILICGLPESGKTTLATELQRLTRFPHLNADHVRTLCKDWDFSMKGRIRQAKRLRRLSKNYARSITDFVAPTEELRSIYNADILIWMDTVKESKYEDTNKLFEPPTKYNYRITTKDARYWANLITKELL